MGLFNWLNALGKQAPTDTVAPTDDDGPDMRFIVRGEGDYDFDIVGESHYQEILSAACGGRCEDGHEKLVPLSLECDPSNPHDKNAVRVVLAGHTVGYLSREDAEEVSDQLASAKLSNEVIWCRGKIVGGWEHAGGNGSFGVKLDIDLPLDIVDAR